MINLKETVLGLELGSTRIKAILLNREHTPIAEGFYDWENSLINGVWTYPMEEIHQGVEGCIASLMADVKTRFGTELSTVGAIGISAMMHGYLPLDEEGKPLCEFRTWRNTITGEAAEKLSTLFSFNIPQRWSIAHLYQAILNGEDSPQKTRHLTTLAGYIHWKLTGQWVMGVGEASGMFPIDSATLDYDQTMLDKFDHVSHLPIKLREILPKVLLAGERAGTLTEAGARFLDPTGVLQAGIPLCPCEGDAGTGMVATNSVRERTGNVSAGTSDFAMIVTDHPLGVHREIDMVTTPAGKDVAMVHCNNCTSDLNAWASLLEEFASCAGFPISKNQLFTLLFTKALEGEKDAGGLLSYNYYAGEGVTDMDEGRPVFLRSSNARMSLPNLMRNHLYSALATLKVGLDILLQEENVLIDNIYAHGGFFKTPVVGQTMLSAAINAPVSCMETAGEGGPYGMALLCAYLLWKDEGESLEAYLSDKVFAQAKSTTVMAEKEDIEGFNTYLSRWVGAFDVEKTAVEKL